MLLNTIVKNSNYITDEVLDTENIVGMANSAIAEVNAKCKTNLPLFVEDNILTKPYAALVGTWCLRIIEPYLSYSIAANDTDADSRDFHYNRFLQAITDLKDNIDTAILSKNPETGEPTGYEGSSARKAVMNIDKFNFRWRGW